MAGLVDYSSSDGEEGEEDKATGAPPKRTSLKVASACSSSASADLPPLPRSFHDIYAANVRTSTSDCPSLHHGRTRAIPHVAGQWPSHIYVECGCFGLFWPYWHRPTVLMLETAGDRRRPLEAPDILADFTSCPSAGFPTSAEHASLGALLTTVSDALPSTGRQLGRPAFHSLLVSDLGVPLPLHISLSRPFVLRTAEKSAFLDRLITSVSSSRVTPSHVRFRGLDWYRSPDSARAFLVLRVAVAGDDSDDDDDDNTGAGIDTSSAGDSSHNHPLVALLARCNSQVAAAGQSTLYGRSTAESDKSDTDGKNSTDSRENTIASSFHVSVAWTLADDISAWAEPTEKAYAAWQRSQHSACKAPLRMCVDSVKVKIGNVVSDIPLTASEHRAKRARTAADASHGPRKRSFRLY